MQRVSSANVAVDGVVTGSIERGLLVLLGVQNGDTPADATWLAGKIASLRIFPDAAGKMNLSVIDLRGAAQQLGSAMTPTQRHVKSLLVVSQFTLIASTRKGSRPSFNDAAKPDFAVPLYEAFLRELEAASGCGVATGIFGADMQVALVNDGPVTLVVDSKLRE